MKRKSPRIHRVKSHIRKNKHVDSYIRGVKKQNIHLSKPTIAKPKGYAVTLKYSAKPDDKEKVDVIAINYHRAIDEAFEEKKDKRMPIEIIVVDPSLGEVIHWAGSHALKYGKLAAQKAYRTAKSGLYNYETKKLVEQAYSDNRTVRAIARAKLRGKYPEVWDVMDISRT